MPSGSDSRHRRIPARERGSDRAAQATCRTEWLRCPDDRGGSAAEAGPDTGPDRMSTTLSIRPLAYGIEKLCRADENLSAGNGGGGQGEIIQIIFGPQPKFWASFENRGQTILVGDVDLAIRQHGRGAVNGLMYALGTPDFLTGFGVQAPGDATVIYSVEVGPIGDGRGNIGTILKS